MLYISPLEGAAQQKSDQLESKTRSNLVISFSQSHRHPTINLDLIIFFKNIFFSLQKGVV